MEESVKSIEINEKVIGDLSRDGENSMNPYQYSPLALAYIGDSALDLIVKTYFVKNSNKQTNKYHKAVSNIVKAVNQSAFIESVLDELSEEEMDVYKRGRNASTHSKAKNATMSEYRKATGLEALLGYLYLKSDTERLNYFVVKMIDEYLNKSN